MTDFDAFASNKNTAACIRKLWVVVLASDLSQVPSE